MNQYLGGLENQVFCLERKELKLVFAPPKRERFLLQKVPSKISYPKITRVGTFRNWKFSDTFQLSNFLNGELEKICVFPFMTRFSNESWLSPCQRKIKVKIWKLFKFCFLLLEEYLKRNFDFDSIVDCEQMLSREVESITPLAIVGQLWQQRLWMFAKKWDLS